MKNSISTLILCLLFLYLPLSSTADEVVINRICATYPESELCEPFDKITVDGVQFQTLASAANAMVDGSVMLIPPGDYYEAFIVRANNVTVIGCGAHLRDTAVGGKGAIVNYGDNNVFECMEVSGVKVSSLNGSGIRHQGCDVTIRGVNFHDNESGILASESRPGCTLTIEDSIFKGNGAGDGYSHNLYISTTRFILRNTKSLAANVGHEIKSRSKETYILDSIIDSENASDSRLVDIPCGGVIEISGNFLRQGPESLNKNVIGIDLESCHHPEQSFQFCNNVVDIAENHILFDGIQPDECRIRSESIQVLTPEPALATLGDITLAVSINNVRSKAKLHWDDAITTDRVRIFRNRVQVALPRNNGTWSDRNYSVGDTYMVCNSKNLECSIEVTP